MIYQHYNIKLFLTTLCLFFGIGGAWGEDTVYKTALFGAGYNSEEVNGYSRIWTATNNGFTVKLGYYNNYENGWNYVKGPAANDSYISTVSAIDKTITKVVVGIQEITTGSINTMSLVVASDANFTENVETINKTDKQVVVGNLEFVVNNSRRDYYYKLIYTKKSSAKDGFISISHLDFYTNEPITNDPVDATWTIDQTTSLTEGDSKDLTLTTNYDGSLSATSENESVATALYCAGTLTIYGISAGSTRIHLSGEATANYNAIDKYIDVTVRVQSNAQAGNVVIVPNDAFWGTNYDGRIEHLQENDLDLTSEKEGVTLHLRNNTSDQGYITSDHMRTYPNHTITFSVPIGFNITDLTFNASTWNGTLSCDTGSTGKDSNKNKWHGNSREVTIGFSGICYINSVDVTIAEATPFAISIPTAEGYGTFFDNRSFVMPIGVRGAIASMNDYIVGWNWIYNPGDVVPANTPILLHGETGLHTAYVTENNFSEPGNNYLFANTSNNPMEANSIATECAYFYALTYGLDEDANTLGFYWREDNGASFDVPAGKVFLALPAKIQAKSRLSLKEDITSIDETPLPSSAIWRNAIFNLSGQRVNASHKGIIIINGKKVYNK